MTQTLASSISGERIYLLILSLVALLIGYYMLLEIYLHLVLLLLLYAGYSYLKTNSTEKIACTGQGVFITGCDTGFGHHTALRLHALGFTVFAGCLQPNGDGAKKLRAQGSASLHVVHLDVTKDDHVEQSVKFVTRHCQGQNKDLWAIINNAAINRLCDIELATVDMMKRTADVNYYGMVRVTKAFLPLLRKSKGRVVNITSVRGRVALPTDVGYTSTKWAGEAFSDILRREMFRFGVGVVIVEPGNYGGMTGMLNDQNIKYNEEYLNNCWDAASTETKRAYGRDYVDSLLKSLRECGSLTCPTLEPVLDGIEDAVTNVSPRYRYLIHGGNRWLDWFCVVAFLSSYLPEGLMDLIIRTTDPLPPVAQGVP